MAGDPYVYPGSSTLRNRLDIKDKDVLDKVETALVAVRMKEFLTRDPASSRLDYAYLQGIHKHLFQDVYSWAGKPRTIGIRKGESILNGNSIPYPHPNHPQADGNLALRAQYAFSELKKRDYLRHLPRDEFAEQLTHHMSEIWEVHPFREGNTRTIAVLMRNVVKVAGHGSLKATLGGTPKSLRNAFVFAAYGSQDLLHDIIIEGLGRDSVNEKSAGTYNAVKSVYASAKRFADKTTGDKDSKQKIVNGITEKAYQRYSENQPFPSMNTKSPTSAVENGYKGHDLER